MNQMEEMMVKPLKSADVWTVIVIDALDECKDEEPQSAILSVLGRFVEQLPKVKFFITGRPEPRIKDRFRLPLLVDSTDVFVLHDVRPSLINSDIRLFLRHELSEVAQRCQLEGWPSDEHIDLLCRRAGGLFVYVVATVRFLDSRIHLPKRQLEVIVNLPECTAYEGKTRFNPSEDKDDPEVDFMVRSTIGTVVLVVNPLPPPAIAKLVGLDPRGVTRFLTLVQSLLTFDEDSNQPVKPFHKSFPDFITDPSRCTDTRFLISPKILHLELAMNCLRVMNDGLEQNLLSLPDYALNSEVEDLETRIDGRISDGLRYACRSWHSHLTKTQGDVAGVVSRLRVFLEEKFLAWLEVVSVLGVARGAIVGLEQLIGWLQEVSGNGELVDTARDYSHFVVTFFEPISVSATHIYHSALELSPLSSIVRKQYYHQRHSSLPRVIVGTRESWEGGIVIPSKNHCFSYTWAPCGQFIATQSREAMEIRDSLSLELLSTLRPVKPIRHAYMSLLAYSTDGRFIASLCGTSLVIRDIQTGGVAKGSDCGDAENVSLAWSLDGNTIGIVGSEGRWSSTYIAYIYNIASGATHSPGTFESSREPHLWAYGTSFRAMTAELVDQACTINIFEVGTILTKVKSFHIESWKQNNLIQSFSQTTHRISGSDNNLAVMDIRSSRYLLEEKGYFCSHCFSSDGSLLTATEGWRKVRIWKYTSDGYAKWREFPTQGLMDDLRFSPTSSSLLGCAAGILKLWRLDGPPTDPHRDNCERLVIPSRCGGYIVAGYEGDRAITVANLLSHTPPCVIDTGMTIEKFTLTGNILLVLGSEKIGAWRLTGEGVVDGVLPGGRAGRSNSTWIILVQSYSLDLYVQDQTVVIVEGEEVIHAYHIETGGVVKLTQLNPHRRMHRWGSLLSGDVDALCEYGWDTPSEGGGPLSRNTLRKEWMKDLEGNCLLWLPVEWRNPKVISSRSYDSTVVWLKLHRSWGVRTVVIKLS
ncbi:hypothetical protein BDM02DRAFT_1756512 [Thelephora ganbajun]|uniref:Uncharacterized protein n=1 Tax=Thelephora ganbajun TaxID=370292 RepID=A0ACB6ZJS4_THEGA|nr:hypothetical protein BDM02DRAFT_1756512 [Thelephora ganbajun]